MRQDGYEVKPWSSLSLDERREYCNKWDLLVRWLDKRHGIWQSWDRVNKLLEHVYAFSISNYNRTHADTSIMWDNDNGMRMNKARRFHAEGNN